VPIRDGLDFIADFYLRGVGPTWFNPGQNNTRTTLFELSLPGLGTGDFSETERDEYWSLDARIGVRGENWTTVLWARNVTDEEWLDEVIPALEFGGSFIHPGPRRRFGVEFTYEF
jgi:iron complex outermembrane receptor protein